MDTEEAKIGVSDIIAMALFGSMIIGGIGAYLYLTASSALHARSSRSLLTPAQSERTTSEPSIQPSMAPEPSSID